MDVDFEDPRLAAEVNSAAAMVARWGERWQTVATRLVQLGACERVGNITELPGVRIDRTGGHHVIHFPDGVAVTAVEVPPIHMSTAVTRILVKTIGWTRP